MRQREGRRKAHETWRDTERGAASDEEKEESEKEDTVGGMSTSGSRRVGRRELMSVPAPRHPHRDSKRIFQRVQESASSLSGLPLCSSFPTDKGKNERNALSLRDIVWPEVHAEFSGKSKERFGNSQDAGQPKGASQ